MGSTDREGAASALADLRNVAKNLLGNPRIQPGLAPSSTFIDRLKKERDEARVAKRTAENKITDLETRVTRLNEAGTLIQNQLAEAQTDGDSYQERITTLQGELQHEKETVTALRNTQGTPTAPTSIPIPDPERFDGARDRLRSFKAHLSLKLQNDASRYPSSAHQVAYAIGLLTGPAFSQVLPYIRETSIDLPDIASLFRILDIAFGDPDLAATAERKLETLKQANREFSSYYAEFQRYASDVEWNESAKKSALFRGLSNEIKDALMLVDAAPATFDEFVPYVQRLDNRIRAREAEKKGRPTPRPANPTPRPAPPPTPSTGSGTHPGPMDLSSFRRTLSPEERQKRILEGRCLYCGGFGHVARVCPNKRPAPLRGNEATLYPYAAPSVTPSLPAYSRPTSPKPESVSPPKPAEN